ncbi:hypothetical protein HNV08_06170 [Winogradskyella eckloniae]|uniref:hypothetical protein n=1 Tax=Winogradskyella eckloniae TaxID=1089306 RepID=UPI00156784DA|nr:hypothetical protein [Winogradskyella eckloniae]NRD19626.1 hypothetical protein [Winogradskyella eckloniae]
MSTETEKITEKETTEIASTEKATKKKTDTNGTFLCEINGKDWHYTKASGIVDTHPKTKKRTAIITFKKKLNKGSESVQLFYDGDNYELEKATAILKTSKKGGGTMSAMYQLLNEGGKRLPDSKISGTLDLSNAQVASGTAEVIQMKIRFEEGELEDQSMAIISFSELKFSGVGYSDLHKVFGNK